MISAVSAHSHLSSRTHQRSGFSWSFWRESNIFHFKVTHLPKFLFRYLFCFSGQKVQRAGVRLDHEAVQNIVRFLLLTFRYVFHPNISLLWMWWMCLLLSSPCLFRNVCITRSAGKSSLSGDDLVSKLEEGSNKWPKASLQVLHRLWSEHGASVHAQQEVQAMLSISQVCSYLTHFQIFSNNLNTEADETFCVCCIVPVGGRAVEARHGSELRHLPIAQLPVRDSAAEDHRALRTDFSEVFWDDHPTVPGLFVCWCESVVCFYYWRVSEILCLFCPLQNFHKQFKEMAAVMETVWRSHDAVTLQFTCKQLKSSFTHCFVCLKMRIQNTAKCQLSALL